MRKIVGEISKGEFVRLAREAHGQKFQYIKVRAKSLAGESKIVVTCPIHGDFVTTVNHHLASPTTGGCSRCEADSNRAIHVRNRRKRATLTNNALDMLAADGIGEFVTDPLNEYKI